MPPTEPTPLERWANEIEAAGKRLHAEAKAVSACGDDPFAQRERIERVDRTLATINLESLKAGANIRQAVEKACVEASAEFWQRFCAAATAAGWDVHGTTERRLVAKAFFVELKNNAVVIDGVPGKHSPHVPAVMAALKPHVDALAAGKDSLQRFADILAEAYGILGGEGEVPIESVFRQCVLAVQPASFWTSIEPEKLEPLTRPMFRARLSAILADNVKPADGRELRLTPTVTRKDVWEVFSPAEGRVVQVGRLAFLKR
jgi:hypothetical protein